MTAVIGARPKTLEESREWLRDRLATRRNPMGSCDETEAAAAIERLASLDGEHWGSVWGNVGARFEQIAEKAEGQGEHEAAREAYLQAASFYFIGRYPCPNHPRKEANAVKTRETYLKAARYFDPPLARVSIPFDARPGEGSEVVVYVRRPTGVARPPVVVLWGGIDGYKEQRHGQAEELLRHGVASITIDMPGTGESPVLASVDAERQYTPVFEWIREQSDLHGSRIGCIGASFGGYWATKLAHTHRQYLAGVVSWGGGAHYGFQPDWIEQSRYADSYLTDLIETRVRIIGGSTYDEWIAGAGMLSLLDQGILEMPSAPLLLVNGREDRQTPIADLYLVLEHGAPKSARIFPGGHMGQTPETFPTIVRWLLERLGGGL